MNRYKEPPSLRAGAGIAFIGLVSRHFPLKKISYQDSRTRLELLHLKDLVFWQWLFYS